MSPVVIAVIVITLLGLAFGLILSVAGKKLAVEVDPRIEQILALLPGANCGGCGHAGCASMADAIVNGQEADASKCAACAEDNKKAIAAVMGKAAADGPKIRMITRLHCNGCTANREKVSNYQGIHNCYVAAKTLGGPGQCDFGCFGYGACADACTFGALTIGDKGLPIIDYDKCVGCGNCVEACPQLLLELVDSTKKVFLQCNNREKGKPAMTNCKVSCISCGMCAKNCPKQAITMEDGANGSIPVIDYDKCVGCGLCVSKCPRHCLVKVQPITADTPEAKESKPMLTGCEACAMKDTCISAEQKAADKQ